MTTSPASARPTVGQALVIILAALVLAVSGCFGVFGVGVGNGNPLQSLAMVAVLPVVLFAVVGFIIGGARLVRAMIGRRAPAAEATLESGSERPGAGQALAIFSAGVVVFCGACMGLVDRGGASGVSASLFTLVFLAGVAAAAAGFALLLWPRDRVAAEADTPPAIPDPPVEPRP